MPNGEGKNWTRFKITLESFYNLYGNWPTKVYLYPFFIKELQEKLSSADFQTLQSKIQLIADADNPFLALDETGNRFDYARGDSCPDKDTQINSLDWLKINEPSYYD